jgi:hypothetical protein
MILFPPECANQFIDLLNASARLYSDLAKNGISLASEEGPLERFCAIFARVTNLEKSSNGDIHCGTVARLKASAA